MDIQGQCPVSTLDGGTWYQQGCKFLKIEHYIHSSYGIDRIERTMQYMKDRIEGFDAIFLVGRRNVN
ncbi:MAG TPA: hypothetical protein VIY08_07695 [Candidatus Nitrosocosmicus sp.]